MDNKNIKRSNGIFYTEETPFKYKQVEEWLATIPEIYNTQVEMLEPFAGSNNLPRLFHEEFPNLKVNWVCFDKRRPEHNTYPKAEVLIQDTIKDFPQGYKVCITKPPYLSKSSASRKKLDYPKDAKYDDLYKVCLDLILENCDYAGVIIPESFITQGIFHDRIYSITSLNEKLFNDTECPVCLVLFVPKSEDFKIYCGEEFLGYYSDLKEKVNKLLDAPELSWKMNDKAGNISVICIDTQKKDTIHFQEGELISQDKIKISSRSYTRLSGLPNDINREDFIKECNILMREYRQITKDVFLTSFKGLREDGRYRRRLDFKTLKKIMNKAVERIENREGFCKK